MSTPQNEMKDFIAGQKPMAQKQYTQEEMWNVFETLPEDLQQAVFSAENADHIFSICERHEINECSKVASLVGLVLMGVVLPRDFEGQLAQDLDLQADAAQRVAQEVNRFIFYPVKHHLEQLHKRPGETPEQKRGIGIATPRHRDEEGYVVEDVEDEEEEGEETQREERRDVYREPIE